MENNIPSPDELHAITAGFLEEISASAGSEEGLGEEPKNPYMSSVDVNLDELGYLLSENARYRIRSLLERLDDFGGELTGMERKQRIMLGELIALREKPIKIESIPALAAHLDRSHSGMEDVKKLLLDQLRLSVMTKSRPKPILLVGAPGSGKTTLALSFAAALGTGYEKIQFSGMTGAFMLSGDDTSFKDAKPGRLIKALINAGSLNPVIILDEVDKAGISDQYGRAINALLEVLDDEQSMEFTDYFLTVPFNFSRVHFILTANSLEGIPAPILDRCIVYSMKGYSFGEKKDICHGMIRKLNSALPSGSLVFRDEQVNALVLKDGSSPGVRGLRLLVEKAFQEMSEELVEAKDSVIVKKRVIESICRVSDPALGYDFSVRAGMVPLLVTGGGNGTLLPVEASILENSIPTVTVTGLAETLLRESSIVAASVARHFIRKYFLADVGSIDIHYPYPVAKNGDSAGLAAALAVLSAYLGKGISEDFAVTGAITLRGQVLAVDGIIEKLLAARRLGFKNVIIPLANKAELSMLPPSVLRGVKIHFASSFEDIAALLFPSAINHVKVDAVCREKTNSGSGLC